MTVGSLLTFETVLTTSTTAVTAPEILAFALEALEPLTDLACAFGGTGWVFR